MLALAEEAEVPERTLRSASPRQKQIVAHARVLLFELVQHELLISLTSPLNLFRELFTVKGAGTLLKKRPPIRCYPDWNQVDHARLAELMVSSFGGVPSPEFLRRPVRRVYMEAQYRGAAVLCDTPVTTYLSKLAVAREAQGEGLGGDLWETLIADEPALFWRARARNPTTDWYVKVCDGLARFPDWTVFWKGLEPGKIPTAIAHALAQPVDIVPVDASRPVDSMRIG
jgi:acetylglutamate synthase